MPDSATIIALTAAAHEADHAWQSALVAHFGPRRAVAERYSYRRSHHPAALLALEAARNSAEAARHAANVATWPSSRHA